MKDVLSNRLKDSLRNSGIIYFLQTNQYECILSSEHFACSIKGIIQSNVHICATV